MWHNIPLRYPGRDYSLPGKYFVTICTRDKRKWFGTIVNGETRLSDIGSIAYKLWHEIPQHFPNITLDEYIIMPDHIHGIIIINRNFKNSVVGSLHATNPPSMHATNLPTPDDVPGKNEAMSCISPKSGSLSVVIRSYKSAVTKNAQLINSDFSWQSRFYDVIICTKGQLSRIRKYIKNNPANWGKNRNGL
jgi:REP element-mobilizing transposase RayT